VNHTLLGNTLTDTDDFLCFQDKSFTCTLFMPFDMFENVSSKQKLIAFFQENFNDAIPLIGEDRLVDDYFSNPRGALITVKTSPHHYSDKAVIVGDAAHAMVPFYGQGMNCGFQDIQVFHQVLDAHNIKPTVHNNAISGLATALAAYSDERVKDAHAICDLAMYNHYEMRSAVTSTRFLARKKLEGWIHLYLPKLITPLYSMVSFSTLPYSQAIRRWHQQSFWLNVVLGAAAVTTTSTTAWVVYRMVRGPPSPPPRQSSAAISGAVSSGLKTAANVANTSVQSIGSLASSAANVANTSVQSIGSMASSAGSSLGINQNTVNQLHDQAKSAAGYVTSWFWK
jgi:kynurenine 3-monooxygenase